MSGESETVWFKEVLDVDENGEITYLEDESRQWERKGEWYGYEGNEDGSYEYVHIDEKKFKDLSCPSPFSFDELGLASSPPT